MLLGSEGQLGGTRTKRKSLHFVQYSITVISLRAISLTLNFSTTTLGSSQFYGSFWHLVCSLLFLLSVSPLLPADLVIILLVGPILHGLVLVHQVRRVPWLHLTRCPDHVDDCGKEKDNKRDPEDHPPFAE